MSYQEKYLKYKKKYLVLKNQLGGWQCSNCTHINEDDQVEICSRCMHNRSTGRPVVHRYPGATATASSAGLTSTVQRPIPVPFQSSPVNPRLTQQRMQLQQPQQSQQQPQQPSLAVAVRSHVLTPAAAGTQAVTGTPIVARTPAVAGTQAVTGTPIVARTPAVAGTVPLARTASPAAPIPFHSARLIQLLQEQDPLLQQYDQHVREQLGVPQLQQAQPQQAQLQQAQLQQQPSLAAAAASGMVPLARAAASSHAAAQSASSPPSTLFRYINTKINFGCLKDQFDHQPPANWHCRAADSRGFIFSNKDDEAVEIVLAKKIGSIMFVGEKRYHFRLNLSNPDDRKLEFISDQPGRLYKSMFDDFAAYFLERMTKCEKTIQALTPGAEVFSRNGVGFNEWFSITKFMNFFRALYGKPGGSIILFGVGETRLDPMMTNKEYLEANGFPIGLLQKFEKCHLEIINGRYKEDLVFECKFIQKKDQHITIHRERNGENLESGIHIVTSEGRGRHGRHHRIGINYSGGEFRYDASSVIPEHLDIAELFVAFLNYIERQQPEALIKR
jgi:hypothetical protein